MKRELKFRVFHRGQMHYNVMAGVAVRYIPGATGEWEQFYDDDQISVMQYTGLVDKYNKAVYEGDIIKSEGWQPELYEVVFIEGAFCAKGFNSNTVTDLNHYYDSTGCAFEVIGNIHEHFKLLEQ